ncbi:MAG: hypothetical protein QXT00_02610 [Ignisphaera sp.]
MGLIFDAHEWERSERRNLITDLNAYIADVKKHIIAAWNDPNERKKLLRAMGEETLKALNKVALARSVLGSDASYYLPVSPDLVVAAVTLLLSLHYANEEKTITTSEVENREQGVGVEDARKRRRRRAKKG